MTSIEWLEQIAKSMVINGGDLGEDYPALMVHIQQAKEKHKQEIIDAYDEGELSVVKNAEQYYQETFVSKGSDEVELPKHPSVISENGNELLFDEEGNLIKELPKQETLYTEEQVREAFYLKDNFDMTEEEIIQSLKQPKKD